MAPEAKIAVPSAAANGKNGHTLISDAKFRQLYALAVKLHLMAEGGDLLTGGHEAALAGVVADLRDNDVLVAHGEPRIAALLHGGVPKAQNGKGSASASSLNERVIEATGRAVADRMRKNGRVTVIYLPSLEAAAVLDESKRLAERARLPVLFVEEAPEWRTPARKSHANGAADSAWMPAIPVDADDVVAMYRVAHESIARAREGSGPTRILCVPDPEADVQTRQRSANAAASLEHWLAARGLPAQEWRQQIAVELGQQGASRWRKIRIEGL
ncbi:MAG TPA: thiamine pyrophosphate-dependent enzyme [Acidobacteriaceae bacterium]|nr:thiamine pyrophosphate-dependent enzyme [Acidobacteriaceae bacterium]